MLRRPSRLSWASAMPLTAEDINAEFPGEPRWAGDTNSADDDGETRSRWTIVNCFVAEHCSDKAWKRLQRTTFVSEAKLRGIVAYHLRTSSNHQMPADEANALALDEDRTIIIEDYETFEDREAARRDAAITKGKQERQKREGEKWQWQWDDKSDDQGFKWPKPKSGAAAASKGQGKWDWDKNRGKRAWQYGPGSKGGGAGGSAEKKAHQALESAEALNEKLTTMSDKLEAVIDQAAGSGGSSGSGGYGCSGSYASVYGGGGYASGGGGGADEEGGRVEIIGESGEGGGIVQVKKRTEAVLVHVPLSSGI